jgi:hypothetical protein
MELEPGAMQEGMEVPFLVNNQTKWISGNNRVKGSGEIKTFRLKVFANMFTIM